MKEIIGENFTGFVHYFTKRRGSRYISSYFTAEGVNDPLWGNASVLLDHSIKCTDPTCQFVSLGTQETAFVQFNFLFSPIYLKAYTLRTRTDDNNDGLPESWKVEGSSDNQHWFLVDEVNDSPFLKYHSATHTYKCSNPAIIKHMKITLTKKTWINDIAYRFHLTRVDFFGEMYGFNAFTIHNNNTNHHILFIFTILFNAILI